MGQGRDLLPESLGPGVKLGPLATTLNASSSLASDDEKNDTSKLAISRADPSRKCEVSAKIWERMVKNAEGNRCSFKRPLMDQLHRMKFDDVVKKMRTVCIDD